MKRYARQSVCFIMLVLFLLGMLSGCGSFRSSAKENGLILSEGSSVEEENAESGQEKSTGSVQEEQEDNSENNEETDNLSICVYICGQVKEQGVYQMDPGSRVYQVIQKAGGLTEKADISAINQAEKVEDGEKIYIPEEGEALQSGESRLGDTGGQTSSGTGKVNINTADKEELMTLNGIGESRAESIIRYREEQGRFQNTEDLKNVSGIGEGIFDKIEADICV